jgi:ABC-type bacteriocin/lantibiotic exporter with double-glycine peptidase domain
MKKFFKQFIKDALSFILWGFMPWVVVIIFGSFMAHYYPALALKSIGSLIILIFIFMLVQHWLKRPR